jgi:hypothetical protein
MDVDVFLHVEEEIAMLGLGENLPPENDFLDDSHRGSLCGLRMRTAPEL